MGQELNPRILKRQWQDTISKTWKYWIVVIYVTCTHISSVSENVCWIETLIFLTGRSLWMPMWITSSTHQWRACFRSLSEVSSRCVTEVWSHTCFSRRSCRWCWWAKMSTTGQSWNRYRQKLKLLLFSLPFITASSLLILTFQTFYLYISQFKLEHTLWRYISCWPPQHTDVLGGFWWTDWRPAERFHL